MTLFGIGSLANSGDSGPDSLASGYALPPMDTFSDLGLTDGPFHPWALVAFAVRVVMVTCALALVLGIRPVFRAFLGVAGVYIVSALAVALPVFAGLGYARLRVAPQNAIADVAIFALFVLWPVMFVLLSVTLAPLAAKAVARRPLRPVFRNGSIWLLAVAGTLIWVFVTPLLKEAPGQDASTLWFVAAFLTVVIESVAYGGIAIAAVAEASPIEHLSADPS